MNTNFTNKQPKKGISLYNHHTPSFYYHHSPFYSAYTIPTIYQPNYTFQTQKNKQNIMQQLNNSYNSNKGLFKYVLCHAFLLISANLVMIMLQINLEAKGAVYVSTHFGYWVFFFIINSNST
jgi:hypothetical protein